ncbi:MAG TPA: PIG-L family deacetylase [Bacillota bacterium]|nr:PIG-L family deacetylase [Bacillota bacterium]HPF42721.1 PIG-L family deacetylase [Bacillota bacterium]HPJ85550.1 PIG-L family deacetylase [Bacillota bacterium]HPQ62060.1 PIG-L family deacetylase [Bacillota bacterium]
MLIKIMKHFVPIPDITKSSRFCFVGPHPDDIEVGAGSTVSMLKRLGKEIMFVIVTDGGSGTDDPSISVDRLVATRKEEAKQSAEKLGVDKVVHLGFPDGGEYQAWNVAKKIAEVLIDFDPDVVFCPDPRMPSEIHPDHLKTGEAAGTASLFSSFPLMASQNGVAYGNTGNFRYRILAYYFTNRPNRIMKTTKTDFVNQLDSLKLHKSQFKNKEEFGTLSMYLKLRQKEMGFKRLRCSGEGFFVLGPVHQHCFTEINRY